MAKRNIWKSQEVIYFLSLMKEKKILGLMDGKRLRISEIFKTLEKPMLDAGFPRDANTMQMKFKNLKRDYYKDRRANNVSGSTRSEFEYFYEMDELLGDRPASQMDGVESARNSNETEVFECQVSPSGLLLHTNLRDENELSSSEAPMLLQPTESSTNNEGASVSGRCSYAAFEDNSDSLEGVPGPSRLKNKSEEQSTPKTSRKGTGYQKSLDKFIAIQNEIKDTFAKIASEMSTDQDHLLMTEMMDRQEKMLKRSTDTLVSALKCISKKGKKRRKVLSPSSSSSSSSSD